MRRPVDFSFISFLCLLLPVSLSVQKGIFRASGKIGFITEILRMSQSIPGNWRHGRTWARVKSVAK